MRVISGKKRGAKLVAPEGLQTRPTTDRIKETLFNIINFDLPGCSFLDLFSGSGAIGIEALSRGSKEVMFVENGKEALSCIKENLEKTKLKDQSVICAMDVAGALQKLVQQGKKFDIIFMDPPYALASIDSLLTYIAQHDLLEKDGYIIVEQGTDRKLTTIEGLQLIKEKEYKTTTLSFFERTSNQ